MRCDGAAEMLVGELRAYASYVGGVAHEQLQHLALDLVRRSCALHRLDATSCGRPPSALSSACIDRGLGHAREVGQQVPVLAAAHRIGSPSRMGIASATAARLPLDGGQVVAGDRAPHHVLHERPRARRRLAHAVGAVLRDEVGRIEALAA